MISLDKLTALLILDSIKGFGPIKFKELHQARISPSSVIQDPEVLPIKGKKGTSFKTQLTKLTDEAKTTIRSRAERQIRAAQKLGASIITYDHPSYPQNVFESNNPIAILYAKGSLDVLSKRETVACVGSRNIREPYSKLHADFAKKACAQGFVIVSGFALGADTIGHRTAYANTCSTICVLPCGLDRPFPPENRHLWKELLLYRNAVFVSEFPFGRAAASLTLRKRNKLIVAFSKGVLISQSSSKGGAMNAYRFAKEQKKPVAIFKSDSTADTSGNRFIATSEYPSTVFPKADTNEAFDEWLQQLS